jgi:hypothetical protein
MRSAEHGGLQEQPHAVAMANVAEFVRQHAEVTSLRSSSSSSLRSVTRVVPPGSAEAVAPSRRLAPKRSSQAGCMAQLGADGAALLLFTVLTGGGFVRLSVK